MIKPDKWIKRQCSKPTHVIVGPDGVPLEFFSPASAEELSMKEWVCKRRHLTIKECDDHALYQGDWEPMIAPFEPGNIREVDNRRVVSYGTSSYGYDVRLDNKFKIFTNINSGIIDPLEFDEEKCLVDHEGDYVIIPPNSYVLGNTIEVFNIPRNVMIIALGKSTYARAGAIVNVTPIEPGFKGQVVIEISNSTPLPMKIHAYHGIAQFVFFESDEACETSYADKNGKYQNQRGVVTPRM